MPNVQGSNYLSQPTNGQQWINPYNWAATQKQNCPINVQTSEKPSSPFDRKDVEEASSPIYVSDDSDTPDTLPINTNPIIPPPKPTIQINWPFRLQMQINRKKTDESNVQRKPVPVPAPVKTTVVDVIEPPPPPIISKPPLENINLKNLINYTERFETAEYMCLKTRHPVYISNLSFEVTRQEILQLFKPFGKVLQFVFVNSKYCEFMNPPSRMAYAYFESLEICKEICQHIDRKELHGKRVNVILGRGKYTMARERLVQVKNLKLKATEDLLYERFIPLGPIIRVSKVSPTEAYVLFKNTRSKPLALHRTFRPFIDGEPIHVYDVLAKKTEFKIEPENVETLEKNLIYTVTSLKMRSSIDEDIIFNTKYYMVTGCLPVESRYEMKKLYARHAIHWLIGVGVTENLKYGKYLFFEYLYIDFFL